MTSLEEKEAVVLKAAETLGFYFKEEVPEGKVEAVKELLVSVYIDNPEVLAKRVSERIEQIRILIDISKGESITEPSVDFVSGERKECTKSERIMVKHDLELYKALPMYKGEGSFKFFYESFKEAMEFAAYEEEEDGVITMVEVPERKQVMLLRGKLAENVKLRLEVVKDKNNLKELVESLEECFERQELSKEKIRIRLNMMKREDFDEYKQYLDEMLKLSELYHLKEEKSMRNKLIIADIMCKHDYITQQAVENCGIKNPDDLIEFLKIREARTSERKQFNGSGKKCYHCKKFGHLAQHCKLSKNVSNKEVKEIKQGKESVVCYSCNETGHFANQCKNKNSNKNKVGRVNRASSPTASIIELSDSNFCKRTVGNKKDTDLLIEVQLSVDDKKGKCSGKACVGKALIDSGSTITIISLSEAKYLGFAADNDDESDNKSNEFMLANGTKWKAKGSMGINIVVEDVKIQCHVAVVNDEELSLEGKYSIIIGSDVLKAGGAVINYSTGEITFMGRLVKRIKEDGKFVDYTIRRVIMKPRAAVEELKTNNKEVSEVLKVKEEIKEKFGEVLSSSSEDIGCCTMTCPRIVILKQFPKPFRYRYSVEHKEIISHTIKSWLQMGVIRKCLNPGIILNLTVADKKDVVEAVVKTDKIQDQVQMVVKKGSRVCIDSRQVNQCIQRSFVVPRSIKDEFNKINKAYFYSKLDLRQFFLQIPLNKFDEELIGIQCPVTYEIYSWLRLPFGLNVSTSFAQSVINEVIKSCEFKYDNGKIIDKNLYGVIAYIDDILIYTLEKDKSFHILVLFCLLRGLSKNKLKINSNKIELLKKEICYLNCVISYMKIKPNPVYINGLKRMKKPGNIRELRRYLGCINFCRDFIYDISNLEKPLLKLLSKQEKYSWNEQCDDSYKKIQEILEKIGFLKLPDQEKQFILFVDASKFSEAGILMQMTTVDEIEKLWIEEEAKRYPSKYKRIEEDIKVRDHRDNINKEKLLPIGYYSKKNNLSEGVSATLLELRGLCRTLDHFKEVTKMSNVVAYTDHKPIIEMLRKGTPESGKYLRYINRIISYDGLTVRYIPGVCNNSADYMSRAICRRTRKNIINVKEVNGVFTFEKCLRVQEGEEEKKVMEDDKPSFPEEKENLVDEKSLQEEKLRIFKEIHDLQGHMYAEASMDALRRRLPYESAKQEFRNFVSKCKICIERNNVHKVLVGNGEFISDRPLKMVQIDCMGPLPMSTKGNKHLMIWIDLNTRFMGGIALPSLSHEAVTEGIENSLIFKFGAVEFIKTDNAKYFEKALETISQRYNTTIVKGVPYQHTSQSVVERSIRTMQNVMAKTGSQLFLEMDKEWDLVVSRALFFINNIKHGTVKESPFFLMMGRRPLLPVDLNLQKNESIQEKNIRLSNLVDQQGEYNHLLCNRVAALIMKEMRKKLNMNNISFGNDAVANFSNVNEEKENKDGARKHRLPERLNIKVGDQVAVYYPKKGKFSSTWKSGFKVIKIETPNDGSIKFHCKKKGAGRPLIRGINHIKLISK